MDNSQQISSDAPVILNVQNDDGNKQNLACLVTCIRVGMHKNNSQRIEAMIVIVHIIELVYLVI